MPERKGAEAEVLAAKLLSLTHQLLPRALQYSVYFYYSTYSPHRTHI
jgi:hypothetical protein